MTIQIVKMAAVILLFVTGICLLAAEAEICCGDACEAQPCALCTHSVIVDGAPDRPLDPRLRVPAVRMTASSAPDVLPAPPPSPPPRF